MRLSLELPGGYSCLAPITDDTELQEAQLQNINDLRRPDEMFPYHLDEIRSFLTNNGVVIVREARTQWIAGYVVADREQSTGDITIDDLRVAQHHRRQGLRGFLLAELLDDFHTTNADGYSVARYGNELECQGELYRLPGNGIHIYNEKLQDTEIAKIRSEEISRKWNGIFSVAAYQQIYHTIYREGDVIAKAISMTDDERVTIHGRTHDNILLGAVDVLNPGVFK